MAGGAVANLDDVFPLWLEGKVLVKRSDAVKPRLAYVESFCHIGESLLRQIVVVLLYILKDSDGIPRRAVVRFQYPVKQGIIKS